MTAANAGEPRFTSMLWSDIEHIYAEVVRHPFVTGVIDGTLPRQAFRHYIVQDAHYLREFARVLAICAAKARHDRDVVMFAGHAANAIAAEQELHASLLAELGSSAGAAAREPVGPTTRAYTNFLLASAYAGSYGEAMGAALPCYWLYAKVGSRLLAEGSPDAVYTRWISAYADPAFQSVTTEMLAATDRMAEESSERERTLVREKVMIAARYEWMFWDAGYRCETWPVGLVNQDAASR